MSGVTWKKWEPDALKKQVLDDLQANGEVVGQFLEGEARKRLNAIKKPDNARAVAWRNFLARYVLTNRVDRDETGVTIHVGMRKGPGKKGEMRGFYIEIGSRTATATSFLRRAVFENARTILATLAGK